MLGRVGPASVWSASFMSVWQHLPCSKWVRLRDTMVCCWDAVQLWPNKRLNYYQQGTGLAVATMLVIMKETWRSLMVSFWCPSTVTLLPSVSVSGAHLLSPCFLQCQCLVPIYCHPASFSVSVWCPSTVTLLPSVSVSGAHLLSPCFLQCQCLVPIYCHPASFSVSVWCPPTVTLLPSVSVSGATHCHPASFSVSFWCPPIVTLLPSVSVSGAHPL